MKLRGKVCKESHHKTESIIKQGHQQSIEVHNKLQVLKLN